MDQIVSFLTITTSLQSLRGAEASVANGCFGKDINYTEFSNCKNNNGPDLDQGFQYSSASQIKCPCRRCTDFVETIVCKNSKWVEQKKENCKQCKENVCLMNLVDYNCDDTKEGAVGDKRECRCAKNCLPYTLTCTKGGSWSPESNWKINNTGENVTCSSGLPVSVNHGNITVFLQDKTNVKVYCGTSSPHPLHCNDGNFTDDLSSLCNEQDHTRRPNLNATTKIYVDSTIKTAETTAHIFSQHSFENNSATESSVEISNKTTHSQSTSRTDSTGFNDAASSNVKIPVIYVIIGVIFSLVLLFLLIGIGYWHKRISAHSSVINDGIIDMKKLTKNPIRL